MAKKLWTATVSIEFPMAIYAETQEEAQELARRHCAEESENYSVRDYDISLSPYAPPSELDDALPWGDFGGEKERTVAELKDELGDETEFEALMRRRRETGTTDEAT